jgi:hypothetical protein
LSYLRPSDFHLWQLSPLFVSAISAISSEAGGKSDFVNRFRAILADIWGQ